MNADFLPGITSVASNSLLLSSTVELLQHVEALPDGSTGALSFGEIGVILIENKRVCWAAAHDMKPRLTDILCEQKEPQLSRDSIEALFERCRQQGTPLGEALVASGLVSAGDLRNALERHTCEAIIRLAQRRVTAPTRFSPHVGHGYDARFVFTTAELLAGLAGKRRQAIARAAKEQLTRLLPPEVSGFAFTSDVRTHRPVLVAASMGCQLSVSSALEMGSWARAAFDVASFVDATTQLVSATWCDRTALVAWRREDAYYVAACESRAASALLLSRLVQLLSVAGTRSDGGEVSS